ncbi:ATP-NAD kinase family protein [Kitasatospora sp. McL0602]|uniref:ATP-NAD kinase family protein n=1 Tax=Kitasatospora sp. McL0602 TaxID=3439530 RepID=UPI003F8BED93
MTTPRVGLVVNPVAGVGGAVGLKGSDGPAVQALAAQLGARPHAVERAALALAELTARHPGGFQLLTAGGPMGADSATAAGLHPQLVHDPGRPTTPADTRATVRALRRAGVRLLLFAGGDGTARDVHDAEPGCPVLGVPTGVKMHSAVFAVHPRAAGEAAAAHLRGAGLPVHDREVLDLDEQALREGRLGARLHGHLPVPELPLRLQQRKTGSTALDPAAVGGIAAELRSRLAEGELLVLGPGTTTRAAAAALGAGTTLLGVDLLTRSGDGLRLLAADLGAAELHTHLRGRVPWVALSPTGGQGFLLGRGNQQLSPALLRAAGRGRLLVLCTEAKLAALGGRPLLLDTGDESLDHDLAGHLPVITGHGRLALYRAVH